MNWSRSLAYLAPIFGLLLIAGGLGGVVIGGYGAVQKNLNLCGTPIVDVTPQSEAPPLSHGSQVGPSMPVIKYSELTTGEQKAFQEGLDNPRHLGHVHGDFKHRKAFKHDAIVKYQNEKYLVTVTDMNRCLVADPLVLPLGLGALLFGGVFYMLPSLRSPRYSPETSEPMRLGLLSAVRDGDYADPSTLFVFTVALGIALTPLFAITWFAIPLQWSVWVAILVGGAIIGFFTSSPSRAITLGCYYAVAAVIVVFLFALWFGVANTVFNLNITYSNPLVGAAVSPFVAAIVRWIF